PISDRRVAGATDYRGLSLGISSRLLGAGQRPCLRTCLYLPGQGDGHPRPTDLASIAVAKSVCRASDWHGASRMPGPGPGLWRGAPAQILSAYATYYNEVRTHLALGKDAPLGRAVQRTGVIVAIPILSGLRHHYDWAADI